MPLSHIKQGVTLTEIMIGMFILALSFLPVIGVMSSSVKSTGKEDDLNRAMNLCQEKLNTAMQFPFDFFVPYLGSEIDNGVLATPTANPIVSLQLGGETINGVVFTSTLTVTDRPDEFNVPVLKLETAEPDDVSTWEFVNKKVFYSNLVHIYALKVSWRSKGEQTDRFYTLSTFRANLREN